MALFQAHSRPSRSWGSRRSRDSWARFGCRTGFNGPTVTHAAYREGGSEADLAADLARFLEEEGLEAESVVTSLPSFAAEMREVPAALHNPKKLARIIKYQVEEMVSLPIEGTVVDFIPSATKGSVPGRGHGEIAS